MINASSVEHFLCCVLRTTLVTFWRLGRAGAIVAITKVIRKRNNCWLYWFDMGFSITCFLSLTNWFHFLLIRVTGKNISEVGKCSYKGFCKVSETMKSWLGSGLQEDVK